MQNVKLKPPVDCELDANTYDTDTYSWRIFIGLRSASLITSKVGGSVVDLKGYYTMKTCSSVLNLQSIQGQRTFPKQYNQYFSYAVKHNE